MAIFFEKVALVTGGASGIGFSIVQQLLQTGIKGVGIVDISDRNWLKVEKNLHSKYPNKILFIKADVTNSQELEDAFEKTVDKFKNLDIVFNNAGIGDEVQWERTVAVNLEAVVRGTYLARDKYLPKYKSGKEGIIINTASTLGILKFESLPVYCATKHGVIGLAKALEDQKSTNNVRIITICPGLVSTPFTDSFSFDMEVLKEKGIAKMKMSPHFIGESVMKLLKEAEHGSVWIIDNQEPPYEINFPGLLEMKKHSNN